MNLGKTNCFLKIVFLDWPSVYRQIFFSESDSANFDNIGRALKPMSNLIDTALGPKFVSITTHKDPTQLGKELLWGQSLKGKLVI